MFYYTPFNSLKSSCRIAHPRGCQRLLRHEHKRTTPLHPSQEVPPEPTVRAHLQEEKPPLGKPEELQEAAHQAHVVGQSSRRLEVKGQGSKFIFDPLCTFLWWISLSLFISFCLLQNENNEERVHRWWGMFEWPVTILDLLLVDMPAREGYVSFAEINFELHCRSCLARITDPLFQFCALDVCTHAGRAKVCLVARRLTDVIILRHHRQSKWQNMDCGVYFAKLALSSLKPWGKVCIYHPSI